MYIITKKYKKDTKKKQKLQNKLDFDENLTTDTEFLRRIRIWGQKITKKLSQQRTLTEGGFLLSCSYLCLCQVEYMVTF